MNHRTSTVAPRTEYHRVLAGESRRIGRGILAILLLVVGMMVSAIVLTAAAAAVDAANGTEARAWSTPLVHAAGLASVALLIPWSMFIQRWLYGVPAPSLHSVVSRFRLDLFGRALLLLMPAMLAVMAFTYWTPLPQIPAPWTEVLWLVLATLLLTPLQAAGEEYGFRGLVFRVAGGWARGARAGLALGVLVSSVTFALVHLSTDPWLNLWYLVFAVGLALVTWRTGGIEVAVVMHALYNTLSFVLDAALRVDPAVLTDRSAGAADASVLVPAALVVLTTVVVWVRTRRTGPARTPDDASVAGTQAARPLAGRMEEMVNPRG